MYTSLSTGSLTASLRVRPEVKLGHANQVSATRSPITLCWPVRAAQTAGNDLLRMPASRNSSA